ncbi:MAG: hypothetical protein WA842_03405 [Croceibacterium sp.]
MSKNKSKGLSNTALVAGAAIGSAAVAAALLYANRRKDKRKEPEQLPPIPSGEAPETD